MIHKRILVFLIAFLPVIISACSDDDDDDLIGKWYRVSDMDGLARNYASSFTIGNKGYLICGNDGRYLDAKGGLSRNRPQFGRSYGGR